MFRFFDANGDARLSRKEFVQAVTKCRDDSILHYLGVHCHAHEKANESIHALGIFSYLKRTER